MNTFWKLKYEKMFSGIYNINKVNGIQKIRYKDEIKVFTNYRYLINI